MPTKMVLPLVPAVPCAPVAPVAPLVTSNVVLLPSEYVIVYVSTKPLLPVFVMLETETPFCPFWPLLPFAPAAPVAPVAPLIFPLNTHVPFSLTK